MNIPECKKYYDVIVAGGGVAGCAAALTCAEKGISVLLLEKKCTLGGLAAGGLVNFMEPLCNGACKQIIRGYAEKWTRKVVSLGYDSMGKEWLDGEPTQPVKRRYTTLYSANVFALMLTDEISHSGADLLFDCSAVEVVRDGNICKGVITASKAGLEYYECGMLIDTTGDCDIIRRMDMPHVKGENYFTYYGKTVTLDTCREAVEKNDIRYAYGVIGGGNINLYGDDQPENIPKWSGLTPEEVTEYIVMNQNLILERLKTTDRKTRDVVLLPDMPQFRTTCRLDGDYVFTVGDAYRHFDDSVCAINDFDGRNHLFEVPLRCLTRKDYPNVITAGRSASGSGYGWDLLRVIPPAIVTGQAAGNAAYLALKNKTGAADADISALQGLMEKDDVMVHFPDEYVPEDKSVTVHGKKVI